MPYFSNTHACVSYFPLDMALMEALLNVQYQVTCLYVRVISGRVKSGYLILLCFIRKHRKKGSKIFIFLGWHQP